MALAQSLWEGSTAHQVLSPLDARRAQGAGWAVNSANVTDVRLGVVYAGDTVLLNATAGLTVNVDPFHFLSSKDPSTGVYQGTNYSSTAVTVPAAPSIGNKRIDTVWVAQQDQDATIGADASTVATFGVVTGAATSGTPTKSAAPTGCTEIGTVTWDSTTTVATATNAAQCTLATTCLWTAARGAPIPVRNQAERDSTLTPYNGMRVTRLDASPARVEIFDGSVWDFTDWTALTLNSGGVAGTFTAVTGYPLQYRRQGPLVEVRGMVNWAANGLINVMTTLPAAVQPSSNRWLNLAIGSGTTWVGQILVGADGTIKMPSGSYATGTATVGMAISVTGSFLLG